MKKKMLHVIESAAGGALQYVIDLCNNIPAQEWEVEVVYSRRNLTPDELKGLFNDNIKLTEIRMTRSISIKKDLKAYKELHKKFREEKWDLIHLHSSKAGALGRLAAKGIKTPVVYTPHGYSFYQQDIGKTSRKIYYSLEKLLDMYKNTRVLVSSQNEFEDARRITNSASRVERISNSVPVPDYDRSLNQELLLITVGRLTAAKNPILMVEVIEEIYAKYPSLKFVWIGDGECRETTEQLARKKNIPFEVTGWMEKNEITQWYQKAQVYLQTSAWEGLPYSLLEAMSYGCSIVATDIPAHQELIESGRNGFLAKDHVDLSRAAMSLIEHPELRNKFGMASRDVIKEKYNINYFAKQILNYYNSALPKEGIVGDSHKPVSVNNHPML